MAAPATEDDEAWLYGAETAGKTDVRPPGTEDVPAAGKPEKPLDKEAGELSGEEGEAKRAAAVDGGNDEDNDDDEDDDDDSDDNVQVTIGDLKAQPYEAAKFKTGYQRPAAQTSASITKTQQKGIDLDTPGTINGVSVFEFDFESLQAEDKPWRKPGADITDYFNYGFNEDTWAKYCERQRRLRLENNAPPIGGGVKPFRDRVRNEQLKTDITPDETANGGPLSPGRRAGPPPGRKFAGTIDVIGSTTNDSRRPFRDFQEMPPTASAEALDYKKYPIMTTGNPIPTAGMPSMSMPPPDFSTPPPMHMGIPPPGMNIVALGPPPNTGIPPPNMTGPPPGFPMPNIPPDPYDAFYPPGHGPPPSDRGPGYDDRPPFGFGPPGAFGGMPNPGAPWDNRSSDNFNYYAAGPPRPDSDFSSSDDERPHRRFRESRDYDRDSYRSRDRSRSRDRHRRDRDRERDRDRDRDRERDRERDRDRDREDRHSRSRRKRDDDDHHKSKHKKSKRSKRDREDEGGGEAASSQNEDSQQT